ncbi:hypothetical protein EVAR_99184_1 [Eumeta japonica]|uniref:Uncharacterized protein n=1 Tax=Eumeta variegata TaxID=151549 RepID=A0A4C1YSI2_EUMVA|nr:hypothetical protein EVAR_99184_1 [Eumeta japonica]
MRPRRDQSSAIVKRRAPGHSNPLLDRPLPMFLARGGRRSRVPDPPGTWSMTVRTVACPDMLALAHVGKTFTVPVKRFAKAVPSRPTGRGVTVVWYAVGGLVHSAGFFLIGQMFSFQLSFLGLPRRQIGQVKTRQVNAHPKRSTIRDKVENRAFEGTSDASGVHPATDNTCLWQRNETWAAVDKRRISHSNPYKSSERKQDKGSGFCDAPECDFLTVAPPNPGHCHRLACDVQRRATSHSALVRESVLPLRIPIQ